MTQALLQAGCSRSASARRVAGFAPRAVVLGATALASMRTMAQTSPAAASAPPLFASSPASLPLRREPADPGFPVGGAVLLLMLVLVAAYVWWKRSRGAWPAAGMGLATGRVDEIKLVASRRLDATVRLHVVEWQGRRLLVAVAPGVAPTVLERAEATPAADVPRVEGAA